MPNIEIKAKCHNLASAKEIAKKLHTKYLGILHQIDTYYTTKEGRLKFREINGETFQLIPYAKDYQTGPMKSRYALLTTDEPIETKALLDKLLGTIAVVDKSREVYLIENVRVHLDTVKDLGEFIEFEAVYSDEAQKEQEVEKVKKLMDTFKIKSTDLLDRSYVDYFGLGLN